MIDIMPRRRPPAPEDPKLAALRAVGALHPRPDAVQDPAFAGHEFFDRRDRVQVKYEMLRQHRVDGRPVTDVAGAFGVSRQAFYATETAFTTAGLPGLLPRPRGPKRAHKCTDAILDFVEQRRAAEPAPSAAALAETVRQRFGVTIHPRSLARALDRRKKNSLPAGGRPVTSAVADPQSFVEQYEALRCEALEVAPFGPRGQGLALFLARGMSAWLAALTALAPSPRPRDDAPATPRPQFLPTLRADLTTVLAGMVPACAPPMEAHP